MRIDAVAGGRNIYQHHPRARPVRPDLAGVRRVPASALSRRAGAQKARICHSICTKLYVSYLPVSGGACHTVASWCSSGELDRECEYWSLSARRGETSSNTTSAMRCWQGDQRTHSHVVALRAVTSSDGMTADWCAPYPRMTRRSLNFLLEPSQRPCHCRGATGMCCRSRHCHGVLVSLRKIICAH